MSETLYPVTVTASYDTQQAAPGELSRLAAWAERQDGRTFTVDHSIPPVRWTVSADFTLRASTAGDAERSAVSRFLSESIIDGIATPQTVIGAAGQLTPPGAP